MYVNLRTVVSSTTCDASFVYPATFLPATIHTCIAFQRPDGKFSFEYSFDYFPKDSFPHSSADKVRMSLGCLKYVVIIVP
jgi:hypothetical protein